MNVVVTGGSGQLGTVILAKLIADRRVKRIVNLDLQPPALASPKLVSHRVDVRDPAMAQRFAGADAVVHLAFVVTQPMPAAEMRAVNVDGSRAVFRAARDAGATTLVYASSLAAYGVVPGQPEPLTEATPRRRSPRLAYGDHKYDVEAELDLFEVDNPAIRVVRMRPGILIGKRLGRPLGTLLARRILLQIGDAPLPIVWDEDVADAFSLALFEPVRGAFNLVADRPLPADELARAAQLRLIRVPKGSLERLLGWSDLLGQAGLRAPLDSGWIDALGVRLIASSERALRELGWQRRAETAGDVMRRFVELAPERLDPRIALFMAFLEGGIRRLDPETLGDAARLEARVHLEIGGRRGGDFDLSLSRGRARLRRGAPRPPTTVVQLSDDTLLDVLAGKLDLTTAQLTGRVQVLGNPEGGWVVGAIVTTFQRSAGAPGARGLVARGLGELFKLGRNEGAARS